MGFLAVLSTHLNGFSDRPFSLQKVHSTAPVILRQVLCTCNRTAAEVWLNPLPSLPHAHPTVGNTVASVHSVFFTPLPVPHPLVLAVLLLVVLLLLLLHLFLLINSSSSSSYSPTPLIFSPPSPHPLSPLTSSPPPPPPPHLLLIPLQSSTLWFIYSSQPLICK